MEDLEIGEVVRLKSGGAPMTVSGARRVLDSYEVRCIWFARAKQFDNWFRLEVLERA
jgi:uncharacterized protein YodC (DUF2158 family)